MSKCPNCGLETDGKFCPKCGSFVPQAAPERAPEPNPTYTAPVTAAPEATVPEQYRPIKAWGYFGLNILFSLPIIGFIMLLVFTFSKSNINRRNYARSFWCAALVGLILCAIALVIILATGNWDEFVEYIKQAMQKA